MKRIRATLSSKSQVTLPAPVREILGVRAGETIVFEVSDSGAVSLSKPKFTIADLRGILPPLDPPPSPDFEAEIDEAMADMADRVLGGSQTA